MSLNKELEYAPAIVLKEWVPGVANGLLVSMCMGCATVGLAVVLPDSDLARLIAVMGVPFLIALGVTRNVLAAVTLVWLNEEFFGVGGSWISLGPVKGRALLLCCLMVTYLFTKWSRSQTGAREIVRNRWVVFYGLVFPVLLAFYAIFIKGIAPGAALSDVSRFVTILSYFPLFYCMIKLPWFMIGWLLGSTGLLAAVFVVLAVSPASVSGVLMEKWMGNFSVDGNEAVVTGVLETGRASFVPVMFCLIGLFLGLIVAITSREKFARTLGFCTLLATASGFVINFIRGPVLGIGIAVLVLLAGLLRAAELWMATKFATIMIALVACGFLFTVIYLPISLEKWDIMGQSLEELLDPVRIEQTQLMIESWLAEPVLGSGIGSSIEGYSRTEEVEGLAFEAQYPMVLYRTGIVGFILIMAPFIISIVRSLQYIAKSSNVMGSSEGLVNLAMCGAIISLLVASAFNPYLASSMAMVFMALSLASDSAIRFPLTSNDRRSPPGNESHENA